MTGGIPPGFERAASANTSEEAGGSKKRPRKRTGPDDWIHKDRAWFASLTKKRQHEVCRAMWRKKLAGLDWRGGDLWESFWDGVMAHLCQDIGDDDSTLDLTGKKGGHKAIGSLIWDLSADREHALTRAVVRRAGISTMKPAVDKQGEPILAENGEQKIVQVQTIPQKWLVTASDFIYDRIKEFDREIREKAEDAEHEWRLEAVRRVLRRRRARITVTYQQIADEMNSERRELRDGVRRPRLSGGSIQRAFKKYGEEVEDETEFDNGDSDSGSDFFA